MRHLMHFFSRIMVIPLMGMTMTACLDDNEPGKNITIDPVEKLSLYAYGINQPESLSDDTKNFLFSEEDIISFNVTTREIKFKEMEEPLYKRLEQFKEIEFLLGNENGEEKLFISNFVGLWDSGIFDNLVLCYGNQESLTLDGYYLYDCYPIWLSDTEEVKANRKKNETQWNDFLYYLETKGKLKK